MVTRVALVSGASTGIGRACGELLVEQGWKVYGLSRSIGAIDPKPPFTCVTADVTRESDLRAVFERVARDEGRLDAVVNCAGFALAGSIEETTATQAQQQFDTNFFGMATVCRLALPMMRAQRSGTIVNISSIAGHVPMAFQAYYSASKAAMSAFTHALRLEVQPFGINAVVVEPGDFATQITASRRLSTTPTSSAYPAFARTLEVIQRDETGAQPPHEVALKVVRALTSRRPRPSYFVGAWLQRWGVTLRFMLPASLFEWVLKKMYRL